MKKVLVACAFGLLATTLAASETILSPNGQVAVTISTEGGLSWQVQRKGVEIILPSKLGLPHGQRSLMDYSPWAHKELDRTE